MLHGLSARERVATIEMKINYLEAVEGGSVDAEANVVRIGRHIAVVDCDVRDGGRRLVGKALMTFFVGPLRRIAKASVLTQPQLKAREVF